MYYVHITVLVMCDLRYSAPLMHGSKKYDNPFTG